MLKNTVLLYFFIKRSDLNMYRCGDHREKTVRDFLSKPEPVCFGIRHIETGEWLLFTDETGFSCLALSRDIEDMRAWMDSRMDPGACEWWEVAGMSVLDLRQARRSAEEANVGGHH